MTPQDAIREAHRRTLDMRASIQEASRKIKAEQEAQRMREGGQSAGANS